MAAAGLPEDEGAWGTVTTLATQKDAENIGIYFKTNDGSTHYVLASNDFRHFSESGTTAGTVGWLRDSATIDGRRYPGNAFNVSKKSTTDSPIIS